MTTAQFNELMTVLRNIEYTSYGFQSSLAFIQHHLYSILCVAMIGLSLWVAFKVLKPYLFRV